MRLMTTIAQPEPLTPYQETPMPERTYSLYIPAGTTETPSFEDWMLTFQPKLIIDSYSFKPTLLARMSRAYEFGGPLAAIDAAKPYPYTYKGLKDHWSDKTGRAWT